MAAISYNGKPVVVTSPVVILGTSQDVASSLLNLGTAANFALLASSTITNVGNTEVAGGDLGLYPGISVTGFPPGILIAPAVEHITDAVAQQAQLDALSAFTTYNALAPTGALDADMSGKTYGPGVLFQASASQLSAGSVTFDAQGDPNATFILQIGSTLTMANNTSVLLINGAQATNILWLVGSSATIGTGVTMLGTIIAQASITLNGSGGSFTGRALALTAAITISAAVHLTVPLVSSGAATNVTVEAFLGEVFATLSTNMFAIQNFPGMATSIEGKRFSSGDQVQLPGTVMSLGSDHEQFTPVDVMLSSGHTVTVAAGSLVVPVP